MAARCAWLVVLAMIACQRPEDRPVARVGDRVVTVTQFGEMAAPLLAGPLRRLERADPATKLKLLDAIVAKELVLLEARARGLDRHPSVTLPLRRLETGLLTRALLDRAKAGTEPTDLEVELYFYEGGFDREIRVSAISCASEEEARQVLSALRSGTDFAALAATRPVQPPGSQAGGDLGYMAPAELLAEVRDPILALQPGQVHGQPLQTRYGLQVVKVTDRRTVTLAERRDRVRDRLHLERQAARLASYTDSLRQAWRLRCASPGSLDGAADDQVLCTWEGGRFTVADYRDYLALQEETAPDSGSPASSVDRAAARQVVVAEARRQGCGGQELRRAVSRKEEELLGAALFAAVTGGITVREEQVRLFYEAHPEIYGPQPAVEVEEILVADSVLASQLRRRVEAGEEMGELAGRYSTREATRAKRGRMWLWRRENAFLGALPALALEAPVGALQGPLAVPGGYSVFRVRQRDQTAGRPLAVARRGITASLAEQARTARMDSLLAELKARYRDRIETYPQALAAVSLDSLAPAAAASAGAPPP